MLTQPPNSGAGISHLLDCGFEAWGAVAQQVAQGRDELPGQVKVRVGGKCSSLLVLHGDLSKTLRGLGFAGLGNRAPVKADHASHVLQVVSEGLVRIPNTQQDFAAEQELSIYFLVRRPALSQLSHTSHGSIYFLSKGKPALLQRCPWVSLCAPSCPSIGATFRGQTVDHKAHAMSCRGGDNESSVGLTTLSRGPSPRGACGVTNRVCLLERRQPLT